MKKFRVLSLVMASALCLSMLAGCGNDSTGGDTSGDNTPAPSGSTQTAGTIKIGGIGPLTGDAAVYGMATKQGAEVALQEINALGGLQFSLDFQDDEGDTEKSVNAYNNLKDSGTQLIYGCTTTNPCISVAGETYADRYFQLTPSASSTKVTEGHDNVFQVCFTDPNQGKTDAYSTGIYNAFAEEAEAIGLEVVTSQTFPDDKNTDFTVQLSAAKEAGADLVFMPIYYTPASLILNQAKSMGYEPTFFGCDGMDGILDMDGFDASLAEGLMLMTPFNAWATDERTVKFVEEYETAYGGTPNQFAADAYDCMYAIYEACTAAGITADMDHETICDKLIETFTGSGFSVDGLTGTGMTWGANGEVSKAPVVVKVEGGVYVTQ